MRGEKPMANARELYIKYDELIWFKYDEFIWFGGHCRGHVGGQLLDCGKGRWNDN